MAFSLVVVPPGFQLVVILKNNFKKMLHEERGKLSEKTQDMKRAIDSLKEELEAVDWYNQRADATGNEELKKILIHNANEEKEHAAMILAWIKKNDQNFQKELDEYLDAKGDIVEAEGEAMGRE